MIKHIATTLLVTLCATSNCYALQSDRLKPAHISADSVQYNNITGFAKYRGHVHATQGTTTIDADEIQVYRNKNHQVEQIVATGQRAHYSTLPDGKSERFHAKANTIKYYPQQGKIELIKNATAVLEHNQFSGPIIRYDIAKQLIESDPSPEGQTIIVLEPRQKPKNRVIR